MRLNEKERHRRFESCLGSQYCLERTFCVED